MIAVPAGMRVLVATKPVDFRRGADSLAALVREQLRHDPFSATIFIFRSKRADRLKILAWDGSGLVLFWKRLEHGAFRWPPISDGMMRLTASQLAALVDGMDWSRLRARELAGRSTRVAIAQAKTMHRRAIETDQNFSAPHAGLALALIADYVSDWAEDPAQALNEAERWARRAVELNEQEPLSHLALGSVLLWRRDLVGALTEFRRMVALDPNFASGYTAMGLGLMYAGQPAEALESIAVAMRLDPHYPSIVLHFLAQAEFSLGKYDMAAQHLRERIARTPGTDSSRMMLAACYGHLGRLEDARMAWAELLKVNPGFSLVQREHVLPYKNAADFRRIADGLAKAGLP
jgi:adenylate cyclase